MTGRIDGLPAPEGPQRTRQSETRRTPDNVRTKERETSSDSVDLSENTRLQEAARKLADIREDRVAQARARIAAGDYDAENVRHIIADRILEQFGV